jgi:glycosyltransferase involved in cell wall biosynthesis
VPNESGLLVTPGDVDELAGALQSIVDNPGLASTLGEGARARAAGFRASAIVPRIEALYRRLIDRRPASASDPGMPSRSGA